MSRTCSTDEHSTLKRSLGCFITQCFQQLMFEYVLLMEIPKYMYLLGWIPLTDSVLPVHSLASNCWSLFASDNAHVLNNHRVSSLLQRLRIPGLGNLPRKGHIVSRQGTKYCLASTFSDIHVLVRHTAVFIRVRGLTQKLSYPKAFVNKKVTSIEDFLSRI